ncbi:nuclear transport factor 2 family protein [Actinokineospora sp. HUAS TT18]|uniref:nuclear transport factor 2 family protein n=1 Tax=Actinokineospora sp. HUAS TT18 TaxID=3447451 RepID=UPI003F528FBC
MYDPTESELASLNDWFTTYDALAAKGAVEEMADLAVFPMNLATDVDGGHAAVTQWSREQYVAAMTEVLGGGTGDMAMKSERTPHFLTANLAVVVTEATMTMGEETHRMTYADLLVRTADGWAFQSMIQGGWGADWPPAKRG